MRKKKIGCLRSKWTKRGGRGGEGSAGARYDDGAEGRRYTEGTMYRPLQDGRKAEARNGCPTVESWGEDRSRGRSVVRWGRGRSKNANEGP